MKFGHEFQEVLRKDDFPQHWVKSAIAYRQLKRCIKRVQGELAGLGLDACTLKQLLQAVEDGGSLEHASFQYSFAGLPSSICVVVPFVRADGRIGDEHEFRPRLIFVIDTKDGAPTSARLSPKTREFLEKLSQSQKSSRYQPTDAQDQSSGDSITPCHHPCRKGSVAESSIEGDTLSSGDSILPADSSSLQGASADDGTQKLVEIPLTSDCEFFHLLQSEVSSLDALQAREEVLATEEVTSLGKEIARVAAPSITVARSDIYRWREIISLYSEADIFYSTNETDHGSKNSAAAKKQFQWFLAELEKRKLLKKFKQRESPAVLNHFLQINAELLRNLRFQEINRLAMTKILKSQYT